VERWLPLSPKKICHPATSATLPLQPLAFAWTSTEHCPFLWARSRSFLGVFGLDELPQLSQERLDVYQKAILFLAMAAKMVALK
jgi:hypothetical protein